MPLFYHKTASRASLWFKWVWFKFSRAWRRGPDMKEACRGAGLAKSMARRW